MIDWLFGISNIWWQWMVPMSIQVSILFAFVTLFDRLAANRASVWFLTVVWWLVLFKTFCSPALTTPFSVAQIAYASFPVSIRSSQTLDLAPSNFALVCFLVWCGGIILFFGSTVWRFHRLRTACLADPAIPLPSSLDRLTRDLSRQVGLSRKPQIRIQRHVPGPAVIGFFRPVIIMPSNLTTHENSIQVKHALLHELCHLQRRDPFWNFVSLLIQLLYWFHPCVWLARRRLATLRELGCDAMVVRLLDEDAAGYRQTLLHLIDMKLRLSTNAVIGFVDPQSQILTRLEWLSKATRQESMGRRVTSVITIVVLASCFVPLGRPRFATDSKIESQPVRVASPAIGTTHHAADPTLPPIDELRGSLQVRYAVMQMLANQNDSLDTN